LRPFALAHYKKLSGWHYCCYLLVKNNGNALLRASGRMPLHRTGDVAPSYPHILLLPSLVKNQTHTLSLAHSSRFHLPCYSASLLFELQGTRTLPPPMVLRADLMASSFHLSPLGPDPVLLARFPCRSSGGAEALT
jgi:hypothetical protein